MNPPNPAYQITETTTPHEPSVGQMLQTFLQNPESAKNVEVAERMFALYERAEARNAEKEFNRAFVMLQADMPVIVAKTAITNRGKYERFEDVMQVVSPLLQRHGFTVSFSMVAADNRITETCSLKHTSGHSQSNSFSVRVGRADTETQADCKAATTAKRNALLNCLNIVIRQDALQSEDDAANEGAFIAWDKAEFLRQQVAETGSDEAAFLRYAGAAKFEEIGENRYAELAAALAKKAKK